jgi:hypothetical protein
MALKSGSILDSFVTKEDIDLSCVDIIVDDTFEEESHISLDSDMERHQCQQRLYIINRSGSGEAQYVLLNQDRTDIESYGVRYETWRLTKNVADFGVAVIGNVLYVIGGYDIINCRHLHRVVK